MDQSVGFGPVKDGLGTVEGNFRLGLNYFTGNRVRVKQPFDDLTLKDGFGDDLLGVLGRDVAIESVAWFYDNYGALLTETVTSRSADLDAFSQPLFGQFVFDCIN